MRSRCVRVRIVPTMLCVVWYVMRTTAGSNSNATDSFEIPDDTFLLTSNPVQFFAYNGGCEVY